MASSGMQERAGERGVGMDRPPTGRARPRTISAATGPGGRGRSALRERINRPVGRADGGGPSGAGATRGPDADGSAQPGAVGLRDAAPCRGDSTESVAAADLHEPTLGAWIDLVDRVGWGDERVGRSLQACAAAALEAVRRMLRRSDDPDELVEGVLVLAWSLPATWRRPGVRGVALGRWLAGVMRNQLRTARRTAGRAARSRVEATDDLPAAPPPDEPEVEPMQQIDVISYLTELERASWDLHAVGTGSRAAARSLGISRDAHRGRLRRTARRVRRGVHARVPSGPAWIPGAVRHALAQGERRSATILLLHHAGHTDAEIAADLGLTRAAVASRLARLRRMWRTSLPRSGGDDGDPCRT